MRYIKNLDNFILERIETKTLYVDKSTIPNSGNGLFAKKDFKKGEVICKFSGDLIDNDEVEKRDVGGERSHYFIALDDNLTLDVYGSSCLARYANDAEGFGKIQGKGNNSTIYANKRGSPGAYIAATRNIKSGEEIFVDYGKDYWDNIKF